MKELQELEQRFEKAISQARMKERSELNSEVLPLVSDRGSTMSEIFATKRGNPKGRSVASNDANPENPSQT